MFDFCNINTLLRYYANTHFANLPFLCLLSNIIACTIRVLHCDIWDSRQTIEHMLSLSVTVDCSMLRRIQVQSVVL